MKIEEFKNKRILILGYGIEGKATHVFLKKYLPNNIIGIADKKLHGETYLSLQKNYDIAIKSPGIHKSKLTIPYTTATNIFFANNKGITIGVTGTKGKSTTAALIYAMLKQSGKKVRLLGNITHKLQHIGEPLLQGITVSMDNQTYCVCELSSQQLEDLEYAPDISVFTNFFPEHMDFHGSIENYWNAKKRIVAFSKEDNFFVYNPDIPILAKLAQNVKAKALPFVETLSYPDIILPILGKHNFDNIRAAATVAKILGIPDKSIKIALRNFKPLPHRMQNIGIFKNIIFIDDAISTTPQSTIYAIETLKNIGVIFLGGLDRGYDFEQLINTLIEYKIHFFVFFPDSGTKILNALKFKIQNSKFKIKYLETKNMTEAVKYAYANAPKGSYVLLSTASPSYSVWKHFEEKGSLFQKAVKKYAK